MKWYSIHLCLEILIKIIKNACPVNLLSFMIMKFDFANHSLDKMVCKNKNIWICPKHHMFVLISLLDFLDREISMNVAACRYYNELLRISQLHFDFNIFSFNWLFKMICCTCMAMFFCLNSCEKEKVILLYLVVSLSVVQATQYLIFRSEKCHRWRSQFA